MEFFADEGQQVWGTFTPEGVELGLPAAWAEGGAGGVWQVRWDDAPVEADRFVLVRVSDAPEGFGPEECARAQKPGGLAVEAGAEGPVRGRYGVLALSGERVLAASCLGVGAPGAKADLWNLLDSWYKWEQISPQDPDQHEQTGEPKKLSSHGFTGVSTPMKVTKTPEEIVTFNPNHGMLWPGAIVRSDQARDHGWLVPVGLETRFRAPLAVTVDQLSAGGSITVPHPDQASVLDAIKNEVRGKESKSRDIDFRQTTAYSATELALELGVSARYGGFSASVQAAYQRKETQNCVAIYLRERAFTASVSWQSPNELINDSFTEEELAKLLTHRTMTPHTPPLIVSDVIYGRVLTISMNSTSTEQEIQAAVKASYQCFADFSAEAKAHYKSVLSNSSVSVVSQGGNPSVVHKALTEGTIADYFKEAQELENYSVIGYVLKSLTGTPAKMSETTDYDQVRWDKPYQANLWLGQSYQDGNAIDADVDLDKKTFKNVTDSNRAEAQRTFSADGTGDPFYASSERWQDGIDISPVKREWFLNGKTKEQGTLQIDDQGSFTVHFWAEKL
ncbi:hypothetical protein FGW37_26170 [Streptomyces rectiverticillatus]|uniref:thiol-activated cytolysin family protein n=1 Tax=Streptomyces rectiverticillatus TaxID=173860 RepID=UPI0015C39846|nr:thiol-activated cytolysin family protein [Streptomyces rectiverticillatus]QLE74610.1 hypothetical protein FGW37_26170 [Streptomyces rectiverticillatus]